MLEFLRLVLGELAADQALIDEPPCDYSLIVSLPGHRHTGENQEDLRRTLLNLSHWRKNVFLKEKDYIFTIFRKFTKYVRYFLSFIIIFY